MTMLVTTFRILLGLFFDDGWLAIAIILIVLLSGSFQFCCPMCRLPLAPCCLSGASACFSQMS